MKRTLTRISFYLFLLFFSLSIGINIYTISKSRVHIFYSPEMVPDADAVLVLGAGIYPGGIFSPILQDRVDTAVDLYRSGKVKKFLLSGDHGTRYYDEVNAMKRYLLALDIPPNDIFLDHAGFETYDSMYRARDIFHVRRIIICTQQFHQYRAIYIARKLGIEAYGIAADRREYLSSAKNNIREIPARIKAWIKIVLGSEPQYLGSPIPISGDGRQSWDMDREIPRSNTSPQVHP